MPISHEFDYARPETLEEAVALLSESGAGASLLAGGTDVVPRLRDGDLRPDLVVDLKGIQGLRDIGLSESVLSIGALATFADVLDSAAVAESAPLVWEMAHTMGSTGIRNRATLAGNICSAVPSCDCGPVLLVLAADVQLAGREGERRVPVTEWFRGPRETAIRSAELVTKLSFPVPAAGHGGCYVKLGRYRGEDLAQASVATLALPGGEYRVAFGAVASTPVRARRIEGLLSGKELDDELVEEAKRLVAEETSPIGDIRASREYRVHMLPVMLERGLRAAVARMKGEGPAYGTPLI